MEKMREQQENLIRLSVKSVNTSRKKYLYYKKVKKKNWRKTREIIVIYMKKMKEKNKAKNQKKFKTEKRK